MRYCHAWLDGRAEWMQENPPMTGSGYTLPMEACSARFSQSRAVKATLSVARVCAPSGRFAMSHRKKRRRAEGYSNQAEAFCAELC